MTRQTDNSKRFTPTKNPPAARNSGIFQQPQKRDAAPKHEILDYAITCHNRPRNKGQAKADPLKNSRPAGNSRY